VTKNVTEVNVLICQTSEKKHVANVHAFDFSMNLQFKLICILFHILKVKDCVQGGSSVF